MFQWVPHIHVHFQWIPHPCTSLVDPHIHAHLRSMSTSVHISGVCSQPCTSPVDPHIHVHLWWMPTSMHISSGCSHPCTSLVDAHINAHLCRMPTSMFISSVRPSTCTSPALTGLSQLFKKCIILGRFKFGGRHEKNWRKWRCRYDHILLYICTAFSKLKTKS